MPPSPKRSQGDRSSSAPTKKKAAGGGADIRAFFSQGAKKAEPKPAPKAKGTDKQPITIDSSDDEVKPVAKPPPKAAPSKAATPSKPAATSRAATTSKHFASSSSKRAVRVESSSPEPEPEREPPRRKAVSKSVSASPRKPTARAAAKRKATPSSDEEEDDIPVRPVKRAAPAKKPAKRAAESDSEDEKPKKNARARKAQLVESESEESEEEEEVKPKAAPRKKAPAKAPAKSPAKTPAKAPSKPAAKAPAKDVKPKVEAKDEADDDDAEKKKKFNYRAMLANRSAGPKAPGSKTIPDGHPGALAGLTFVFTGELESLGRDDAVELAKRYFGRVTGAPSKLTSYVVLGENAGPSKIKKIEALGTPTINEDEFLELIRTRKGKLDDKQKAAIEKQEKKILEDAKELEQREREEEKLRKRKEAALEGTGVAAKKVAPASAQLWTTKYAPKTVKEICGNKGQVAKLQEWLSNWQKSYKSGFRKPGKNGTGMYRAVLLSGPPGIGKTTSAHIIAKECGYTPLEVNASDARSKKLVENSTNIDNTSLDGFFQGKSVTSTTVLDANVTSRTCLIMDEVDGMSAGDRGGVGALTALCKKTKIPVILICNDKSLQKMKPITASTNILGLPFRRPTANEIRSRILSILYKEKLKIPSNVVDELVQGVNSDIRQVLNMLSTFKLSKSEMNFDDGKQLVKLNEKNTIMTPFTIIDKLTGPYAFSRTSKETLGDRMELYFQDFSFVPLFMQEHYLKTNPSALTNLDGPEKQMKNLELLSKAADSISDGDIVDRMIHSSEQQWSLLPLHAVTSTISPAYYIYGPSRATPGGGWGGPAFPQWLGQNSKMGKLSRELTDIQIRMRLRVSGSRDEIRQQYMPLLASKIVTPLAKDGSGAIDEVIETMDEYYLGKDDWDAFVELGVDEMRDEAVLKKIPSAVKSAFTRTYNKKDHPIAFHKGDMFAASRKKVADTGPPPDNDEVFEDDAPPPDDKAEPEEDVNDYTKDKLIKAVKPKGKGKAK